MNDVGEILSEPGSPEIEWQRWVDLIRDHPNLVPSQPREIINPFTKKPMILRPRLDLAHVIVEGKDVGTMCWAEDGSKLINVFGETDAVIPVAQDIARLVGGRFQAGTDV